MRPALRRRLQQSVDEGRAAPLELALADWALRHGANEAVAIALSSCARAVADGHICLDLTQELPAIAGEKPFISREKLNQALTESNLAGTPEGVSRPLVADGNRLYLQRYLDYEKRLATRLLERLRQPPCKVDRTTLEPGGGLFESSQRGEGETHWQAVAAFVALRHRLTVISGGPGTGKTYTVVRLMRLLVEAALDGVGPAPIIHLAAPTGKAAARMQDSTRTGLEEMDPPDAVRRSIPLEAQTLHRLIGIHPRSTRPRHDRDNPLNTDAVIVDEASMVDLPMMARLVDAMPDRARLILLGDRYQLASVESGSVLAELCNAAGVNTFSQAQKQTAGALLDPALPTGDSPLADHVVTLQTSHRFDEDSAIGQLAAAVNDGDSEKTRRVAQNGAPAVAWSDHTSEEDLAALVHTAATDFEALARASDPEEALASLQSHCLLCALRRGPTGSVEMNRRITLVLARRRGFDSERHWFHGRPIMVTRNDYHAGLYNGDTGICLFDKNIGPRVWFDTEGGPTPFLPTALPNHETAFALTVHKSQGSEYEKVTLVLPPQDSSVLTRELLYTGITRARQHLQLFANENVLHTAVHRRIKRFSGLAERLRAS